MTLSALSGDKDYRNPKFKGIEFTSSVKHLNDNAFLDDLAATLWDT